MFRRTSTLAIAGLLAAAPALAACGSSSSGDKASASLPTVKIMVGGIDKQIYLPFKLADELGFYKKYGVKVELSTEQDGGVGAEDAMASGQVDIAGAWYNHAIELQAKGKQAISLVQLSGAPGERIMCTPKSGVKSGADIKGKTMGVTDLGSGTDTLTKFVAEKAGVSTKDYHTIAVGAGATAVAALQNGSADCVMTTQPTVTALESKGIATSAIDLATTEGATSALGGAWPAACAFTMQSWVDSHKAAAQGVTDALVATMHWINTHTAAEIADKMPTDYVQNDLITKADYTKALEQDKGQFLPDGLMPKGGPETSEETEKLLGVDVSKVDLAKTFTTTYVQNALKKEGITPTTTPEG